jgi:GMP synthase-like glutamine amidotransferase
MRIGILQAGSVAVRLQPRHGDYPDMFRRLLGDPGLRPTGSPAPEFLDIDARHGRFPDPEECDAYLVTGSRHSVYDHLPWIAPLAGFVEGVLERQRPVVGICFGHQLIAHYLGGETRAAAQGWGVGVQQARVTGFEPWMNPPAECFKLLVSHRDQVVRVPPGAQTFAVGENCPVAGFVLGSALAFQGHPEFSKAYAAALMDTRREILGEDVYRNGTASLDEDPDTALVARWIWRFVSRDVQ